MGPGTEQPTGASSTGCGGEQDAVKGGRGFDSDVIPADNKRGSIDVIPKWDPSELVLVDDLVEKLKVACMKLGVGPPEIFPFTIVCAGKKDYFTYGVHLRSTPEGVNFLVSGRYSMDQWLAREDAAFITLERLLEERGKKLWDFNYMVSGCFRDQAEELRRLRTVPLADRMSQLEEEIARLKDLLACYTNITNHT
ncbi:hypothetical protein AHAS_Ahas04G0151100 [Arachis hypogaea]